MRGLVKRAHLCCLALLMWMSTACAWAQAVADPARPQGERLQVAAPFIELHTGPGRGYPVFHVVEARAWIRVLMRRTDWFLVQVDDLQSDITGWVSREQVQRTLTEAGSGKTLRDVLVDDYLQRRVEFGLNLGRMRSEPMLKLTAQLRLGETLGAELALGQVQGSLAGTDFWHLGLVSEPFSHRRLSPYLVVGVGRFRNLPNASLVGNGLSHAKMGHAGLGLRWYVSERFVAKLEWSAYAAFVADNRSLEYRAVSLGLAFFH